MKYVTTPIEEFKGLGLNPTEKMILSIYKYYTEQGKRCTMTNDEIADELEIGIATMMRAKKKFKEMNLIRTNGGIIVYYLGVKGVKMITEDYQNDNIHYQNDNGHYQNDNIHYQNDNIHYQNDTHNKEIKNKENKEIKTHFDEVVERLPPDYKTKEILDKINETFKDKISHFNNSDNYKDGIDSWVSGITSYILSNSLIEFKVIEKKEDIKKEFVW